MVSFDAWKEGQAVSTRHEVTVAALKRGPKLEPISFCFKRELMHPNKTSVLHGLRYSPDGKRIIAGDYPGGVVVVWDAEMGDQLRTIETGYGYRGSAEYFFLSPDWQSLFVSRDNRDKRKITRIEQDGKRMSKWDFEGDVRTWDLATGELLRTYNHQPPRNILRMELSADGTRFATLEQLAGVYDSGPPARHSLWDVKTGQYVALPDDLGGLEAFSPDGRSLAATTVDKDGYATAIKLLDAATGTEKWSVPVVDKHVWIGLPRFSPDGRLIVASYRVFQNAKTLGGWQSWLKWWDADTGKEIDSFAGDNDDALHGRFSPDGQTLAATNWRGEKKKLVLFRVADRRLIKRIDLGEKSAGQELIASSPSFSPDSRWIAILTQFVPEKDDENLDVRDLPQPRILLINSPAGEIRETLVAPPGFPRSACFSPDGKTLATGGHGRVLLWDLTKSPASSK